MYTKRNQRRRLLKYAASSLAAPLLGLSGAKLQAQSNANSAPLRFMSVIDTYGMPFTTRNEIWVSSSAGDYALNDSDLGTILQPLRAYRDNMLVISGTHDPTGLSLGGHHNIIKTLSGSRPLDRHIQAGARLSHPSLDVTIGNYLNSAEYGLTTARPYSHLSFSDYSQADRSTFSFDAAGNEVRTLAGAKNAATAIFGGGAASTIGASESATINAERDVLDMVSARVRTLKNQMATESRTAFLEAYESSVVDLSQELELRLDNSCPAPDNFDSFVGDQRVPSNQSFDQRYQIFEVFAQLFACDMASSIAYNFGSESINQLNYGFLYDADEHNDADVRSLLNTNYHVPSHRDDDPANKAHEIVRTHQAQLVAQFLDAMAQTPDVDGSMVIDNLILYLTSPLSYNTHKTEDYPLLIIAGKNTNLVGGYHYDCSDNTNNDVLATLAQGATLSVDSFGGYHTDGNLISSANNGPIARMLKTVY